MATKTITGNGTTALGDSGSGSVTTKVIQLQGTAWSAGTVTVMGRLTGSALTLVALPYRRRYLNGAVGDEGFGSSALTGDSLIEVNANGVEISLVAASLTATSIAVSYVDLDG